HPRVRTKFHLPLFAAQHTPPRPKVDSVSSGKILCNHRPMKSDQTSHIAKVRKQTGNVAVADQYLGMRQHVPQTQQRQEVICTITSARTEHRLHVVSLEHLLHFAGPPFRRPCKIEVTIEDRLRVNRLIGDLAQYRAPCFKLLSVEITRRSDDADPIPRLKRPRLDSLS